MIFFEIVILLGVSLPVVSGSYAQDCSNVTDCACGQQCVDVMDLRLCHSSTCACYEGCAVGSIFIPPGIHRPDTYCNLCSCGVSSPNGIPMCTRRQWCSLPEGATIYQENPACGRQHDYQDSTIFRILKNL